MESKQEAPSTEDLRTASPLRTFALIVSLQPSHANSHAWEHELSNETNNNRAGGHCHRVCMWPHQIFKSKSKEQLKVLFSLGLSGTFVWKLEHFVEFWSYGGPWHKTQNRVCRKIYLSRDFYLAILGFFSIGKVLVLMIFGLVQIITRLESQSKFQMYTLFWGEILED